MRSLSFSISQSLLKLMSIESVTPPNHFILYHPLLLLSSIFSSIRVFSKESALCITWPKYWNFSISPSNEYSGLISFRMDWVDLLALQGVLKSLLQHHSSKASTLQHSFFFMVQLAHPYMMTEKDITFTIASYPMRKHTATSSEVLKLRIPPQSWQLKSYWWAVGRVLYDGKNYRQNSESGSSSNFSMTQWHAKNPCPSSWKLITQGRSWDGTSVFDFLVNR